MRGLWFGMRMHSQSDLCHRPSITYRAGGGRRTSVGGWGVVVVVWQLLGGSGVITVSALLSKLQR